MGKQQSLAAPCKTAAGKDGSTSLCLWDSPGILTPGPKCSLENPSLALFGSDQAFGAPLAWGQKEEASAGLSPGGDPTPQPAPLPCIKAAALPMSSAVTALCSLHNGSTVEAGSPPARPCRAAVPLARGFGCIRAHKRGVTQGRCCLHLKSLAGTEYVGSGVLSAAAGGVEAFSRTLSFKLSPALLRRCRRLLMLGSAVCCPAGAERGCRMQQEVMCPSPALIPTPGVTPL